MELEDIKKNCKYVGRIDDDEIICQDGLRCECEWQVKCGAYFDCDEYVVFMNREHELKCKKDNGKEWSEHYCTNDCNTCGYNK